MPFGSVEHQMLRLQWLVELHMGELRMIGGRWKKKVGPLSAPRWALVHGSPPVCDHDQGPNKEANDQRRDDHRALQKKSEVLDGSFEGICSWESAATPIHLAIRECLLAGFFGVPFSRGYLTSRLSRRAQSIMVLGL